MIVQWCVKGLALANDNDAEKILTRRAGLICNWWRNVGEITPEHRRRKLTPAGLDLHVNHFTTLLPNSGEKVSEITPFISLSAGVVERDAAARSNLVHRARRTALWFGTDFGRRDFAYLFTCWVILAPRPAVEIEGVAEEVRDLNAYRRYSEFQTEGEIVAKVIIPDNQIKDCEKWELDHTAGFFSCVQSWSNPRFTRPEQLTNIRELI